MDRLTDGNMYRHMDHAKTISLGLHQGITITCDHSIHTIDHIDLTISNFMENSMGLKRVKLSEILFIFRVHTGNMDRHMEGPKTISLGLHQGITITCNHSIHSKDHIDLTISNFMENSMGLKRVKLSEILFIFSVHTHRFQQGRELDL